MQRWIRYADDMGNDSLMRAAFLESKIDHMGGGISREKRSVDYSREKIE